MIFRAISSDAEVVMVFVLSVLLSLTFVIMFHVAPSLHFLNISFNWIVSPLFRWKKRCIPPLKKGDIIYGCPQGLLAACAPAILALALLSGNTYLLGFWEETEIIPRVPKTYSLYPAELVYKALYSTKLINCYRVSHIEMNKVNWLWQMDRLRFSISYLRWRVACSGGYDIWFLSTIFQKSNIGWPQRPPTERMSDISE